MTPIPKQSADQTPTTNWRPIANLNPLSKLSEWCLSYCVKNYLFAQKILNGHQFAFREKRSCELLNLLLTQKGNDLSANKLAVDAIFLNCSKAFDRVDYCTLLNKVKAVGLPHKTDGVLHSNLKGRKQSLVVKGCFSGFLTYRAAYRKAPY